MCVYLAPRWRRRSVVLLVLALVLVLQTTDAKSLRRLNSVEMEAAGQVTTNVTQSATTVATKFWSAGENTDGSQHVDEKSVSFKSLVQTTTAPFADASERSLDGSATVDDEVLNPEISSSRDKSLINQEKDTETGEVKQGSDKVDLNNSADSVLDSKSNDKIPGTYIATIPSPTSAPTPVLTPAPPPALKESHGLPPHTKSFDSKPRPGWPASGSSEQNVTGQSYEDSDPTTSANALEKQTQSASSITASTSFDHMLVVGIVGVVAAIAALLMVASRKVLKEMSDDKDLEDSSIF